MSPSSRLDVYNTILSVGLVPLFYHDDLEVARQVARASVQGGSRILEFTNRGPNAMRVFIGLRDFINQEKLPLILGVGSVVDAPTAALYIAHGAEFVVSPIFNPEVTRLCNRRKIGCIPGCATASEISQAEELGAEIVKIFPGESVGGPDFVKALMGPMPWTRILPTGGVEATQESLQRWFKAGAAAVGMGSNLVRKEWLQKSDYSAIQNTIAQVLAWIQEARGK